METLTQIKAQSPAGQRPGAATAFTAAQMAACLDCSPQAIRKKLRGTKTAGVRIVNGKEAATWAALELPQEMICRLDAMAVQRGFRNAEAMLAAPPKEWQPALPLDQIADGEIERANKLRAALLPALTRQHDYDGSAAEFEAEGLKAYAKTFGHVITPRHWRALFKRTLQRDGGAEIYNRLELYLSDQPHPKNPVPKIVSPSLPEEFAGIENYLRALKTPERPDKDEVTGIWALAMKTFREIVKAGETEKRAARRVRQFLFASASFLAKSRNALRMAFERRLERFQEAGIAGLGDGRAQNGNRVEIPEADIDRLRFSTVFKNDRAVDAAWREEYPLLSEVTRQRYTDTFEAPAKIHEILNREIVDALADRHEGKRKLRRKIGGVQRDWTGIPSMHSWVADDVTADIQVVLTDSRNNVIRDDDGVPYLFRPQVIAVMDSASRKFVGICPSVAKAPNAGIVCDAVLDGIKTYGSPKRLGVENGKVFGKSLLVNGKEDEQGKLLVVGLGQFGCEVDHFEKMNPTSKSEIEYGFRQIQRLMARCPGYTSNDERTNASEAFKLQERLIRADKVEATKTRLTYNEFIVLIYKLIAQYNATKQGENSRLKGLSPDEAFLAGMDVNDPPIKFTPKLEWLLNERQIVTVSAGGVNFTHRSTGKKISVSGGPLTKLAGEELWAILDRQDASMVTFMNQNFTKTFTLEVLGKPSAREADFAHGSGILAKARAQKREHERAFNVEYNRLKNKFGDPSFEMLAEIRGQTNALANVPDETTRRVIINSRIEASGEQMKQQRAEITAAKAQKTRRTSANKSKARRLGIPSVMVDDDEQTRRALELLGDSTRTPCEEIEVTEENQP